jgi:xanthine dehydrogenase YagR molybdenum-binding subunit
MRFGARRRRERFHAAIVFVVLPVRSMFRLDIPDYRLNTVGAHGIGEIGITSAGAAVDNTIVVLPRKRVRDLPITPDNVLSDRSVLV